MMRTISVALAGYLSLLPPPAYAQTFAGWSLVETPHFRLQIPPNPHARTIYGGDFDRLVAEFEAQVTGGAATSDDTKLETLRATAQARFRRDRKVFTAQEFRDLEALYQAANRNIRAPEARDLLLQVISKYPKSNRAGCAVLYLAQISSGSERESFLKRAIAEHADDWYGNGVQVGALARAYLAGHYADTNRRDEAIALAEEVRKSFPEAVDHSGGSLIEMLQRMKLLREVPG